MERGDNLDIWYTCDLDDSLRKSTRQKNKQHTTKI